MNNKHREQDSVAASITKPALQRLLSGHKLYSNYLAIKLVALDADEQTATFEIVALDAKRKKISRLLRYTLSVDDRAIISEWKQAFTVTINAT